MGRVREAWRALTGQRAISSSDQPWADILGGGSTASGVNVTPASSLRVAAVYAGVRLIAESISSLPVDVVRRQDNRRESVEDGLTRLITDAPNSEMDAAELWRTVMGWMLLEGNAYVYVERDRATARPVGLWPLPADAVTIGRDANRELFYDVHIGQVDHRFPGVPLTARLPSRDVLHYRAFGTGLYGLSPIRQIREAVGTALASQEYMARFYDNDASPGGVISVPENLSDEQYQRMREGWKAAHQGLDKSHLLAILEGGAKWETVGLNPQDAAFIETQKWETAEVARALGIPPHMIGDVERSTSWGAGIAEQGIGFVTYTLTPWITRLEQVTRHGLLGPVDSSLRVKWRVDGLQRGDTKSRYDAYAVGRNWGWLSANDVRQLEDMDPVPDGDTYLQPLNMAEAGAPAAGSSGGEQEQSEPQRTQRAISPRTTRSVERRRRIAQRFVDQIEDADRKLSKLERSEVLDLARKHLDSSSETFLAKIVELYGSKIVDRYIDRYEPILATLAAEVAAEAGEEVDTDGEADLSDFVRAYVESHADQHQQSQVAQIRAALEEADQLADVIEARMDQMVEQRPRQKGVWESHQMANAAAREQWREAGVESVRWASGSRGCAYCRQLDGREVGVEAAFVRDGDEITDDQEGTLTVDRTIQHPPVHPHCDCTLVPV